MYSINRRKFLGLFGCGCCSLILPSCSTVPITERKQLSIIPEYRINQQAASAYENFRKKAKLITSGSKLNEIREIGKRMENSVSSFFINQKKKDPTKNFEWDYILVENDKMVNAWCMPGGKIAVYTGILDVTKNINGLAAVMGHEIAHAVAKHSLERASQAMTINLGTTVADIFLGGAINRTRNTIGQNTGMDIFQIGIFPEAKYIGPAQPKYGPCFRRPFEPLGDSNLSFVCFVNHGCREKVYRTFKCPEKALVKIDCRSAAVASSFI